MLDDRLHLCMALGRSELGTVLEIAALGPAIFAAAGPSFFTVRQFTHTPEGRADIRFAEVFGTTLTLSLGVGASLLLPGTDYTPIVAAVIISGIMVGMYEYALHNPRNGTDMQTGEAVTMFEVA